MESNSDSEDETDDDTLFDDDSTERFRQHYSTPSLIYINYSNVYENAYRNYDPKEISFYVWKPPENHGLENSDPILKDYNVQYYTKQNKMLEVDYLKLILDDIGNYRPLDTYQMQYIQNLSPEQMYKIIEKYNSAYKTLTEVLSG